MPGGRRAEDILEAAGFELITTGAAGTKWAKGDDVAFVLFYIPTEIVEFNGRQIELPEGLDELRKMVGIMESKPYRIHWWYEDMGGWEIEPADSDEAMEYMKGDPLVELDPVLVSRYERARQEYSRMCEEIRNERNRQVVRDKDRRWVPRKNS